MGKRKKNDDKKYGWVLAGFTLFFSNQLRSKSNLNLFLSYIYFSIFHVNSHWNWAVFGLVAFIWMHWRPLDQKNFQNMIFGVKCYGEFAENKYYSLKSSNQGSNHGNLIILLHDLYRSILWTFTDNSIRFSVKFYYENHLHIFFEPLNVSKSKYKRQIQKQSNFLNVLKYYIKPRNMHLSMHQAWF